MPMDLNNNVIDCTQGPSSPASCAPPSPPCHKITTDSSLITDLVDEEHVKLDDGVRGNSLVIDGKRYYDSDSQCHSLQRKESATSTSDSESLELIPVEEIRDDIELIVDLYLLLENTRWLFHCVLW